MSPFAGLWDIFRVITASHAVFCGGAFPLKALCGHAGYYAPIFYRLLNRTDARNALADGDLFQLVPSVDEGAGTDAAFEYSVHDTVQIDGRCGHCVAAQIRIVVL